MSKTEVLLHRLLTLFREIDAGDEAEYLLSRQAEQAVKVGIELITEELGRMKREAELCR